MQFDNPTSQFISTNFFGQKVTDEENYKSVVRIFGTAIFSMCNISCGFLSCIHLL